MVYLKANVLLMVDAFERIRSICLEYYENDLCFNDSTPGLDWLCGLKYTGAKISILMTILLLFMILYRVVSEVVWLCY